MAADTDPVAPVDPQVARRRLDHLHAELCVAAGRRLPRFALWMALAESGARPGSLAHDDVVRFCGGALERFLREREVELPPRRLRRLVRRLARFDARRPTPEERLGSLTG
jgi:hypothetical protein